MAARNMTIVASQPSRLSHGPLVCVPMIDRLLPTSITSRSSGGARSPFVRRLQADVYGLPVVRVNREEGPAFGAALLAAVGVGAFPDLRAAAAATLKRLAAEAPDRARHEAYSAPYARFRALYPALRAVSCSGGRPI